MPEERIDQFDKWLQDDGPVAIIVKQPLAPVDDDDPVIFPPTYPLNTWNGRVHTVREGDYRVSVELPPDSKNDKSENKEDQKAGYNIDRFPDGTNVCEVDSPQSQSNRIEPRFKVLADGKLVPQIKIQVGTDTVNLLDVGHRAADAVVRMSSMASEFHEAFVAAKGGNFFELAKHAPTSLVFGVWDSRSTHVKVQRTLKAHIRATDIYELSRSAQYTPATDFVGAGAISEDVDTGKGDDNNLSAEGMKHALSTQTVGGVKLTDKGTLTRTVNLNLAALRALRGKNDEETEALQRYVLGLALVAATAEPDLNLREGCNLRYDDKKAKSFKAVYRCKPHDDVTLLPEAAMRFAEIAAKSFFKLAGIDFNDKDRTNVSFESGVATDYLERSAADRKKISQLGPITRATLARYDAQGKDPFKPVTDKLKEVKKLLGRKPPKSKPRIKKVGVFTEVTEFLTSMANNDSLPDGAAILAGTLAEITKDHEDSHEAAKSVEDQIKNFKKALKEGSLPVSDSDSVSEGDQ